MLNKEIVYREVLSRFFENRSVRFTQLELSRKFGFSLSTIHNALKPLRSLGAISVQMRSFTIIDSKKFLTYWATARRLGKDVIYSTHYSGTVREIEQMVPSDAVFTAYSAYIMKFKDAPADYSEVYFYLPEGSLAEAKKRFPEKKGPPNVFILKADKFLEKGIGVAPVSQVYVDLWNLKEWYARAFLDALEKRMEV